MKWCQQKVFGVCLVALLAATGWASENLKLTTSTRDIPERGKVASAQVNVRSWNASFIVPAGWRLGADGDKVVLQSQDFSARIEFTLTEPPTEEAGAVSGNRSRVMREFGWLTPLGSGYAVESEYANQDSLRLIKNQIRIPQPAGTLEMTFIASPEKYAQHQKAFQILSSSLRSK